MFLYPDKSEGGGVIMVVGIPDVHQGVDRKDSQENILQSGSTPCWFSTLRMMFKSPLRTRHSKGLTVERWVTTCQ